MPVSAGDLVIGDARLLHSAHGNQTDSRRTVITMWYLPRYDELSEPLRAAYQKHLFVPIPDNLAPAERCLIEPLLPDYSGDTEPEPWNRVPTL